MKSLKQLLLLFKSWFNPITEKNNRLLFYQVAISCLGTDVTPEDTILDSVACAETVNAIHFKAFGFPIGGGASTYWLWKSLERSAFFIKVNEPFEGDIIISPTGTGKTEIMSGHVGIVGELSKVMANDSNDGLFKEKYTLNAWRERWGDRGGYPIYCFRRL